MGDDSDGWRLRFPDFDVGRLKSPERISNAMSVLECAIQRDQGEGEGFPEFQTLEGWIARAAWAYIETEDVIQNAPTTAEVRARLAKMVEAARSLAKILEEADPLTRSAMVQGFREARTIDMLGAKFDQVLWGDLCIDFRRNARGDGSWVIETFNAIAEVANQSLKRLPARSGGKANLLGLSPQKELVGECAIIFDAHCRSHLSSGKIFKEFVGFVHEIATGTYHECDRYVGDAVAIVNRWRLIEEEAREARAAQAEALENLERTGRQEDR